MIHMRKFTTFFTRLTKVAIPALAALVVFGCSPKVPKTLLVGTVTLDGSPVANATLEFSPTAGDGAVSLARTDQDGRYMAEVSPARLRVVITALKAVGKVKPLIGPADRLVDDMRNALPERYGLPNKTPLVAEPAQGETTTADFALTSSLRDK